MADLLDKLELRQIYLILGSVTFLVLTAMVMFTGKPLYERYDQVSWELDSLRQLNFSNAQTALQELEGQVDELQKHLMGDLQMIPTRQLESHIIAALQDSAWQSEIDLLSIEPLPKVDGLPYEEISFRLEVEGRYFNLDDWINSVSNQLGYVVFKEYVLKISKDDVDPILHARLMLSAYRMEAE